ncbi:MAG: DUF115 domain-containing protein [Spirochaetaceae bacterium]|nr:DUF115 domain-containing protein [Spirochaetaceae bacterium]
MIIQQENSKPCLVDTGQGLSVLYKNRLLYSKYNPKAAAEKMAESIELKEDTLVLCFSPVLGYGLDILQKRLPKGSFAMAIEANTELYKLYDKNTLPPGIAFISPDSLKKIPCYLSRLEQKASNGVFIPSPGSFKRCIRLDFSGGTIFENSTYTAIHNNVTEIIAAYWKNRMTLVKLGRLYNRNIFRNLWKLPFCKEIKTGRITKPILVMGAGPSANKASEYLRNLSKTERSCIYIIAVDAAIGTLLNQGITPDAAVAQECQYAIQQAYAQAIDSNIFILADLTSRHSILEQKNDLLPKTMKSITGGDFAFYITDFADTYFLRNLKKQDIMPLQLPPLGSVGITATELALKLRANNSVPVMVVGLDFSFPAGITHAKASPQFQKMLFSTTRLKPAGNPSAAFSETAQAITETLPKIYTDYTLNRYAMIFSARYNSVPALYKIDLSPKDLGIPSITINQFIQFASKINTETTSTKKSKNSIISIEKIIEFYSKEEEALLKLKKNLIYGGASESELKDLLFKREYLFLHFPDGHTPSLESQFLKRVRAEIDFFLKDIAISKEKLKIAFKTANKNT